MKELGDLTDLTLAGTADARGGIKPLCFHRFQQVTSPRTGVPYS